MPGKESRKRPVRKTAKTPVRPAVSPETVSPKTGDMLSIWFFVGLMLTVLGVIVTLTGVYYIFSPQHDTKLAELNPNLWWGAIILAAGLIFLVPSWKRHKAEKQRRCEKTQ